HRRKQFDDAYVRELEEQVKTLNRLVDANNLRAMDSEDAGRSHIDSMPEYPANQESDFRNFGRSLSSGDDDKAVDARSAEAMEDLGSMMLKLDLRDEGEPNFTIATSETQTTLSKESRGLKDNQDRFQRNVSPRIHAKFSDMALKTHLIDMFCIHFNRFHQVVSVDEASAMSGQDLPLLHDDMLFRNMAILAIGALYSDASDASALSQSAAETAESLVLECLKFSATPLTVQGLTLMSWLYLMLGIDMASWNLNFSSRVAAYICFAASATGLVLRLGLHVTALTGDTCGPNSAEQLGIYHLRVRTFWCYFSIDRYAFDWKNMTTTGKQSLMSRSYKALLVFYGESHTDLRCAPSDASDSTMNYVVCAAAIHLLNATSGRTGLGRRSAGNLKICMDTLLAVGDRWDSRKDTSIRFIRKLAHKWKVVWALPLQFSAPFDENGLASRLKSASEEDEVRCISQPQDASLFTFPETLEFPFNQLNTFPEGDDTAALTWLFAGHPDGNEIISPDAEANNSHEAR
ncbi:hypothetical protein DL98DRAFT_417625, partial [Cadophora sp. DSE1049]